MILAQDYLLNELGTVRRKDDMGCSLGDLCSNRCSLLPWHHSPDVEREAMEGKTRHTEIRQRSLGATA